MPNVEVIELHADDARQDQNHVANFAKQISNMGFIFIAFLAPWCGHCQAFKPEWEKTKDHFKKGHLKQLKGHIVTTDDKTMQRLPRSMQASGFPTLSLFNGNRKIKDYNGGRNMREIVDFLKKHMKKTAIRKKQLGGRRSKRLRNKRKRKRTKKRKRIQKRRRKRGKKTRRNKRRL